MGHRHAPGRCRTAWLTEPSTSPPKPSRPWLPTASNAAPADSAISVGAGPPRTVFSTRSTFGKRDRQMCRSSASRACSTLSACSHSCVGGASTSSSGPSQVRTAVTPMPRRSASWNARLTAAADCREPSTPTTTRPTEEPVGLPSAPDLSTTTGHWACIATWSAVEPSSMPAKPPRPAEPSTRSSACGVCPSRTADARPSCMTVSTWTSTARSCARATATSSMCWAARRAATVNSGYNPAASVADPRSAA